MLIFNTPGLDQVYGQTITWLYWDIYEISIKVGPINIWNKVDVTYVTVILNKICQI